VSILCGDSIRKEWLAGNIGIDPEPVWEEQLQPASLDLRLGPGIMLVGQHYTAETMLGEGWTLKPREFVLAHTVERVRMPSGLVARVSGRSSWGRRGLAVHITAGFVDPGFDGELTLELYNHSPRPIELSHGVRVCQLVFERLDRSSAFVYSGRYQGQTGPTVHNEE
jgi:dCTP deaminase